VVEEEPGAVLERLPSLMRVMGPANWWDPQPLRWLHGRIGLSEPESGTPELPSLRPTVPAVTTD
jgi:hypothetical protein